MAGHRKTVLDNKYVLQEENIMQTGLPTKPPPDADHQQIRLKSKDVKVKDVGEMKIARDQKHASLFQKVKDFNEGILNKLEPVNVVDQNS